MPLLQASKWVSITAKGRGKAPVRQSSVPARTLTAYLALPVEQYSLLDPTWIERYGISVGCTAMPACFISMRACAGTATPRSA